MSSNTTTITVSGAGRSIPFGGGVVRDFGKPVDQPFHFLVGARRGDHADHNGDDETGRKRDDGDPEVLRHLRREGVEIGDPAALAFGGGGRERQDGGERCRAISPAKAPWAVVRFQNMPSRNVANSGAFTQPKTSCSRSMMLL